MTKDRLAELKLKINGHDGESDDESSNLMVVTVKAGDIKTNGHLQKLSQQTNAIQESLWQIQEEIAKMRTLHGVILGTITSDPGSRQELAKLTRSITTAMAKKGRELQEIKKSANEGQQSGKLTKTEFRMVSNVADSLIKKFQGLLDELTTNRTEYENRCKHRIQRQLSIAGYSVSEEDTERMINGDLSVFSRELADCQAAKLALRDMEERHHELLDLEKSLIEMHDLFIELNLLVVCQGETIDRIEAHVGQATFKVAEGKECLGEARQKQSALRRKKIICTFILLGAILIALLIGLMSWYFS